MTVLTQANVDNIRKELSEWEFDETLHSIIEEMVDTPLEHFDRMVENGDFMGIDAYDEISRNAIWNVDLVNLAQDSEYTLNDPYLFTEVLGQKMKEDREMSFYEITILYGQFLVDDVAGAVIQSVRDAVENECGEDPMNDDVTFSENTK